MSIDTFKTLRGSTHGERLAELGIELPPKHWAARAAVVSCSVPFRMPAQLEAVVEPH